MTEILIMIGVAISILLPAWLILRIGKVKGLVSYRGIVTYLLLVASWAVGWMAAMIFVPLWAVGCLIVQILTLVFVAKLPLKKAVLLSVVYTAVTSLLIYGIAALLLAPNFS